jgi:plasmid stability protein
MTVIELPDQQAAVLKARAAAQGLSLEAWLKDLADEQTSSGASRSPQEAVACILQVQKRVRADPEGWTVHDYIDRDRT